MIHSYFTIAIRRLLHDLKYTVANVLGLAVGLATAMLILLYVLHELSVDNFHQNSDQIYRIIREIHSDTEGLKTSPGCPQLLGDVLAENYPEIRNFVRLRNADAVFRSNKHSSWENEVLFADPSIFNVFSFPLIYGDAKTALNHPSSVVLTEEAAQRYFGDQDPMGQELLVGENEVLQVTGILALIPSNSHIQFDILRPMPIDSRKGWFYGEWMTYILVSAETDIEALQNKVYSISTHYVQDLEERLRLKLRFRLQPLGAVYLKSDLDWTFGRTGSSDTVYALTCIAFLILFIAIINFTNLATVRAMTRSREVGMRKVLGAQRIQTMVQFLGESFAITTLATVFAFMLVELTLPFFNQIAGKHLSFINMIWLWVILLVPVVGFLAGIYPAFVLSSWKPVEALRSETQEKRGTVYFRQIMIVIQFASSVGLIVCAQTVHNQLSYMRSRDLGFESGQVIVLNARNSRDFRGKYELVKEQMLDIPGIVEVAASSSIPGRQTGATGVHVAGAPEGKIRFFNSLQIDAGYVDLLEIRILAGRNFDPNRRLDVTEGYLLNEAAVQAIGWSPDTAIGKRITCIFGNTEKVGQVLGIVGDYHHLSPKTTIAPTVITVYPPWFGYLLLKVRSNDTAKVLEMAERKWTEVVTDQPFEFDFLDENYEKQYRSEERLGTIFTVFSTLAIVISCVGLFALAAFTCERRKRELTVRKVLGATTRQLATLLFTDFMRLIVLANILAWPVAYLVLERWLEDFAYRTIIGLWPFIYGAGVTCFITLLTLGSHVFNTVRTAPVEGLRHE